MKTSFAFAFFCAAFLSPLTTTAQWAQTPGPEGGNIAAIASAQSALVASAWGTGIYRSTDAGGTWMLVNPNEQSVSQFLAAGDTVLAIEGQDSVLRSTNGGQSWMPFSQVGASGSISGLLQSGGSIFATSWSRTSTQTADSTWSPVYRSTDGGFHWDSISAAPGRLNTSGGFFGIATTALLGNLQGTLLLANDSTIYRSSDDGGTWTPSSEGIPQATQLSSLAVNGQMVAAGGNMIGAAPGLFLSNDGGITWQMQHTGLEIDTGISCCFWNGSDLLAATATNVFIRSGGVWSHVDTTHDIYSFLSANGTQLGASSSFGLIRSSDEGHTWTNANNGVIATQVSSIVTLGATVVAATTSGLFRSGDDGGSWQGVWLPGSPTFGPYESANLAADGATAVVGFHDQVYRSTDGGMVWNTTSSPQPQGIVSTLAVSGSLLLASSILWTQRGTVIDGHDSLYFSSDRGQSWHNESMSIPSNGTSAAYGPIAIFGDTLFVVADSIIARSWDNGANWVLDTIAFNDPFEYIASITEAGGKIFLAGPETFVSSDAGSSWQLMPVSALGPSTFPLYSYGNNLFVMFDSSVWRSTDLGSTWVRFGTGFNPQTIPINLAISNNYMLAGTYGNGVWRRPLSDLAVQAAVRPERSISCQVSPNPSGKSTTIYYSLPEATPVTVEVFDPMGRVLLNDGEGYESPGPHTMPLSLANLPDGIYFVRLSASAVSSMCRIVKSSSFNSR